MNNVSTWDWLRQRLWAVAGAVGIRAKVLGMILAPVLLLGLGITLQMRATLTSTLSAELEQQGVSIARDVAARSTDLILINDLFALHRLLQETQQNNSDVIYAFVIDEEGQIFAHTFGPGFPAEVISTNDVVPDEHHHGVWLETDQGRVWDVAVPVFDGRAGTTRIGLSAAGMNQTINAITGQLLLTTMLVSAGGIAAATLLTWVLTRPILRVVEVAQAVEKGDLSQRLTRWANDEIGDLAEAFNAMTAALSRAEQGRAEREQLRAQYVSGVIAAQEEERKRVARELHDSTSQTLTSLLAGLRALEDGCETGELRQHTVELRRVAAQTLEDVHSLAVQLRPSILDDLGLAAALERQVANFNERHAAQVDLVIHGLGDQRLPAAVETALYRIVQEALTNIARHARAHTASVLLEKRNGNILAIIEDDGEGFELRSVTADRDHLGLHGIRERTELLGGSLEIESEPGKGATLYVEIPVQAQARPGLPFDDVPDKPAEKGEHASKDVYPAG